MGQACSLLGAPPPFLLLPRIPSQQSVPPWSPRFQRGFPWGGFLAKGGFKSVRRTSPLSPPPPNKPPLLTDPLPLNPCPRLSPFRISPLRLPLLRWCWGARSGWACVHTSMLLCGSFVLVFRSCVARVVSNCCASRFASRLCFETSCHVKTTYLGWRACFLCLVSLA